MGIDNAASRTAGNIQPTVCPVIRPAIRSNRPVAGTVDRYRRLLLQLAASAQALVLLPLRAVARPERASTPGAPAMNAGPVADGRHDFDFLHGQWQIRNERLKQRLAGSTDWEIFHASQWCQPMLGGIGNVEDFVSDWHRPGSDERFIGMTLRLFSPESRQWSIYWAGNHDGRLEPPMVGHFDDGTGTFRGHGEHDGRPVQVRFLWNQVSANTAHWQQAFSQDQGETWETNWHMWFRRTDGEGHLLHDDGVIELRQYALRPGRRDDLVELFEREFIEPQEAVGMHVIGQFRDLDDDNRFVWMRGFPDMSIRAEALGGFYGGPTWARYRDDANDTMVNSDDVLLLRPARPDSALASSGPRPAQGGATDVEKGLLEAGICYLDDPADSSFVARFEQHLAPRLRAAGAELIGVYVTESAPNTFPRLPVREGEPVLVWFARFTDVDAHHRYESALLADGLWNTAVAQALLDGLRQPPQRLRLAPTRRSELRI
ncbi:NIPSNAP family protein [Lysobacter sp. S4-A87]|uniref:NIPSNAP family protein n=1 Tax=Lysobacter sp. S4-A87 TaxID=2925843 RepID=UPI001F531935|nr:NIPSNAP family protein [Lysobacter sp. S4-A87]UNK48275.1 NIPSNAP family protein [Lysobacter sp. S4-A87]